MLNTAQLTIRKVIGIFTLAVLPFVAAACVVFMVHSVALDDDLATWLTSGSLVIIGTWQIIVLFKNNASRFLAVVFYNMIALSLYFVFAIVMSCAFYQACL